MLCTVSTWIAIIAFIALILLGGATQLLFMRYCADVAALEGREAEYAKESGSVRDGGFAKEQFQRLAKGNYPPNNDMLKARGIFLKRIYFAMLTSLVVTFVLGVYARSPGCS